VSAKTEEATITITCRCRRRRRLGALVGLESVYIRCSLVSPHAAFSADLVVSTI
jgi:hypothetical protein